MLVKLYSSHFSGETVEENSSNKHFSQVISTNLFYNNSKLYCIYTQDFFLFFYFYHAVGSFALNLSSTMFGIFRCCSDMAFGVIYLHPQYARQVLLLCAP